MPNHCSNLVKVTGPRLLVTRFLSKAASAREPLEFDNLFPCPPELRNVSATFGDDSPEAKERVKKYGYANWYDWCVDNWSTKWGAYDMDDQWHQYRGSKDGKVQVASLNFTTAWAPATNFWRTVSKLFPKLTFTHTYSEPGCAFCGWETFQKGEMVDELNPDWDSGQGREIRKAMNTL